MRPQPPSAFGINECLELLFQAGELFEWNGCAFVNASCNGVFAALMAAEELTRPSPIFEGEMGFFKQVSGKFQIPVLSSPDQNEKFMINKASIKF